MHYRNFFSLRPMIVGIAMSSGGLVLCESARAQQADTAHQLSGIEVTSRVADADARSLVPVQVLDQQQLSQLNSLNVADAIKHFSGVIIRDYGGLGGLKTVSVRSLGANHTGIIYDGMAISDIQTGQIDLGKYSLNNLAQIALYNGQPTDILSPARNYTYASALVLNTADNTPGGHLPLQVEGNVKAGSFGFFNPALTLHFKATPVYTASFNTEYRTTKGDYPFLQPNADSEERKRRENAGINSLRLEQDNRFHWKDSSSLQIKEYFYDNSQQLPGAVILYSVPGQQHLWTRNAFLQSSYFKPLDEHWQLRLNGKLAYIHTRYLDPGLGNNIGLQDNKYNSTEGYFSAAIAREWWKHFTLAYSGDVIYNKLTANIPKYAYPERYTFLNAITARYHTNALDIQGNLLSTVLNESVKAGATAQHRNLLTPTVGLNWQPFAAQALRLRAFYKKIFRSPSFDELYYNTYGNPTLKPEYAKQYNVGATWQRSFTKVLSLFTISADGYYNDVKNKIIVLPGKNAYEYSILNYGTVHITGVDVNAQLALQPWHGYTFSIASNYTLQEAIDVTNRTSPVYGDQLPYTPRNSGGVMASVEKQQFTLSYNLLFSGYRYALGNNTPSNFLQGFAVHDVQAAYRFRVQQLSCRITAAVNNLTDKSYLIIRNFPMPQRSYQIGIQVNY